MGQLLKYSGITTKIRAMNGRLLKPADYEALAAMPDIRSATEYLSRHPAYAELLSQTELAVAHRSEVEKLITQGLFLDFQKIYGFCGQEQRKFLRLYYKRYEIDLIKYLFRALFSKEQQPYYISTRRSFFEKYSRLDLPQLIAADTAEELIGLLAGTEYHGPLSRVYASEQNTLFDYEITLDLYYFSLFWKSRGKLLKGSELASVTRNYGSRIDMLNIQWIYRAKKYYNLSVPQIYAMAIPIHYKLKKQEFINMVEAADLETFLSLLKTSWYGSRYDLVTDGGIEQTYRQLLDKLYQGDVRKNPYSLASVNTYLYKKEQEIDILTSILECIRYGLPYEETLKYI